MPFLSCSHSVLSFAMSISSSSVVQRTTANNDVHHNDVSVAMGSTPPPQHSTAMTAPLEQVELTVADATVYEILDMLLQGAYREGAGVRLTRGLHPGMA
jgi:hypothetical protein